MNLSRVPQNPDFLLRGSNKLAVHARQWFEFPGRDDGSTEIWCYTDRLSYAAGDTVTVFAISTKPVVNIEMFSQTSNPVCVFRRTAVAVSWIETDRNASVIGCNWPDVAQINVDPDWPSGAYKILLRAPDESETTRIAQHLIIIRPSHPPAEKRLLLITADCTWNAYNDWGGSNHYEGVIDPQGNRFSARLSNQRPFARGFIALPDDAPRTLPRTRPPVNGPVSYPHMQWAWDQGYSKKYASAGWASYEKHFVNWALDKAYPLDLATQQDLHYRPEILNGYACIVMVGHDEYWSWSMRDTIDNHVESGGCIARFAGNFLWQIRLQQQGLIQVCHKYLARQEDPFFNGPNQHLTTNCWEAAEVNRPGHSTFGLDASRGMYAGWGGLAPQGAGGFTLYRPDHWAFQDSGLGYGDVLGGLTPIFGYEVDGLDYRIEQGLPYPSQKPELPEDLEILALGLARMREQNSEAGPQDLFVGDEDAKFMAQLIHGRVDQDALERVNRGSGMIVSFSKGKGQVFHAGATEWIAGLIYADKAVERVTANVLNRFLNRPQKQ